MKNQKQDVSNYLYHLRGMQATKVKFLHEADPNMPPPAPVSDAPPDVGSVDPTVGTSNVSQEATEDIQMGAITLEMVIDKFNTVRAGRSFKDKAIKQQMMTYFEKLSDEEKVALYAFLKGISQIVSGEFTGYDPVSPADVGAADGGTEAPPEDSSAPPAEGAPPAEEPPQGPTPPNPANAEPPAAEAPPPAAPAPPAPAPEAPPAPPPAPAPTKKVIKTIKPNIIRMHPAPTNPAGEPTSIPITPKVR